MAEFDSRIGWPGWETKEILGQGSYAAVYEIQRVIFGHTEKAAMKVISLPKHETELEEMRSEGLDDRGIQRVLQEKLENIVSEYILMRKLNGCSNVVNCDDVRYQRKESGLGWEIYIKMELLTPLAKALDLVPNENEVYRVGKDLCRALLLCKRHNILHRDIKPANTFLSRNGDYKLGDFGIAKTVEKTVGGTKIGTFEYMAPEVYNNQPYGPRADIYSLGLVLYWLLNERRTPFLRLPPEVPTTSEKEEAKLRRFRGEQIPPPCHGGDTLKRIVLRACAFDPEERYQSPEEMLRDLEKRSFALRTGQRGRRSDGQGQGFGGTMTDDGTMGVFYGRGRNGQEYREQNGGYNGQRQEYREQNGGSGGQRQEYREQNGGYNGQRQEFREQNGGYNGQRQEYREQNGGSGGQRQEYRERNGGSGGQRQEYWEQNGGSGGQRREYQGQNGGSGGQRQEYQGQNGGSSGQRQEYREQNGGSGGQRQEYREQNGGYNGQRQDNRSRSGQNSYQPVEEFESYDYNPYVPDLNGQDSGSGQKRESGILGWARFRNAQKRQQRLDDLADPEQLERESWGDFDGQDVSEY